MELGESLREHRPPGKLQLGTSWDENESSTSQSCVFSWDPFATLPPTPHPSSDIDRVFLSLLQGKTEAQQVDSQKKVRESSRSRGCPKPASSSPGTWVCPRNRTLEHSTLMISRGTYFVLKKKFNIDILNIK